MITGVLGGDRFTATNGGNLSRNNAEIGLAGGNTPYTPFPQPQDHYKCGKYRLYATDSSISLPVAPRRYVVVEGVRIQLKRGRESNNKVSRPNGEAFCDETDV